MSTELLTQPTGHLTSPRADASRDLAAIAPGLLPFGIALGVVIAATRMGDAVGVIGAPLVYGGSAQLTATTMFDNGAGILAILGAALTVNARLLLYGAALAPRFRNQPRWFRLSAPHLIIDQTYVSALARPQHAGRAFRVYWLWLGLGVMAVWTAAVGAGVVIGPRLPPLPHVALAGAALFIGMLMPRLRDRPSILAALTAAAIAPLIARLLPRRSNPYRNIRRLARRLPREEGGTVVTDFAPIFLLAVGCWLLRIVFIALIPGERFVLAVRRSPPSTAPRKAGCRY